MLTTCEWGHCDAMATELVLCHGFVPGYEHDRCPVAGGEEEMHLCTWCAAEARKEARRVLSLGQGGRQILVDLW